MNELILEYIRNIQNVCNILQLNYNQELWSADLSEHIN